MTSRKLLLMTAPTALALAPTSAHANCMSFGGPELQTALGGLATDAFTGFFSAVAAGGFLALPLLGIPAILAAIHILAQQVADEAYSRAPAPRGASAGSGVARRA